MDAVLVALVEIAQPMRLLILFSGVVAGLIIGVVPGIGGIFGLALLIPLTYHLDPYAAFALLLGMGSVTTTSDTIPAVLFGVPGTVGAAATVLDGHAMAKKGEAARAFGAAYSASLIGGVFGALVLAAAIPIMRPLVLYLKTPDFFAISAFGLSIVAMLAGSQPLKGFAAAMLGMLLSFVGLDDQTGSTRWAFGQVHLWEGLPIVVVFLGLFGLPELAALLVRGTISDNSTPLSLSRMSAGIRDTLREWPLVLRCSWIGALLGAVPGIGVVVLDWIAYGHASRKPGDGPKFGQGNVRGVIAPESANNAKEGGSLIPTIAFGVPGSASMSVLLGAFVIQGLVPGPDMLGKNASVTISMVFSIAIANILGAVICLFLTRPLAAVARVPAGAIIPVVVTFIVVGTFQNAMTALDFVVLLGIGILGMAMKELNWPRSAFALGFVLGPLLEKYFFLSYQIAGWGWLKQPIVLLLLGLGVLTIVRQGVLRYRSAERPRGLPAALPDTIMAAALTALGAAAIVTALAFPSGSGIFPALTASLLTALAAAITVTAALRLRRERGLDASAIAPEADGEWSPTAGPILRGDAIILALCAVLAVAILAVGHLAGSLIFLIVALTAFRSIGRMQVTLTAIGATLVIAGIFDVLVSQPWPKPWLAGLLGFWPL